jgi:RNA polymerase sigma-70 factor (ECF subfamily)
MKKFRERDYLAEEVYTILNPWGGGYNGRAALLPKSSFFFLMVSDSSAQTWALRDPDVRLMVEVRGGSTAAFEELMRRYQNRVATILFHLVRNRDLAEDLTQEVFLRVFRARHTYRAGAKFSTWLFTIAHNVAMEALRTRSRRRETRIEPDGSGPLGANPLENLVQASSSVIPARAIDKAEARDMVHLAIDSLNERQRMAVLLCRFEGMCYADIAETMGLTPQAVKSLLSRARSNLRDVLKPYIEQGNAPPSFSATEGSV